MATAELIDARLTTVRLESLDDPSLRQGWDRLASNLPFRQWQWLSTWWDFYRETNSRLLLLGVYDSSGELAGLAPWHVERDPWAGRVVRFLGSGEVCSDYLTILAEPESAHAVARAVAAWLDESRDWDAIELDGMSADDAAIQELVQTLGHAGHCVVSQPASRAWRTQLPSAWPDYVQGLRKQRRGGVRTLERRFFDTGRATIQTATDGASLARGLEVLAYLHQRRRESLGDAGCFASPRFHAFLAEAAARFLATGQLRLQWTELDGQVVAAAFCLLGASGVYYYQSGIEPDAMQQKPGWLQLIGTLKQVIAEGYTEFDFLRGDEPYKLDWRAEPWPLAKVRIASHRPLARWRHRGWLAQQRLKQWLRPALTPQPETQPKSCGDDPS